MHCLRPFAIVAVAITLMSMSGSATAQERKSHADDQKYWDCAKACDDCARICDACATHCARLVAEGKKEHLHTEQTCLDCASICRAAGSVTARSGPFSDLICTACADACKRCGDACERHKEDPIMKRCADECRTCEKACREMLKHVGHAEKR
jgi:hypothetical protein